MFSFEVPHWRSFIHLFIFVIIFIGAHNNNSNHQAADTVMYIPFLLVFPIPFLLLQYFPIPLLPELFFFFTRKASLDPLRSVQFSTVQWQQKVYMYWLPLPWSRPLQNERLSAFVVRDGAQCMAMPKSNTCLVFWRHTHRPNWDTLLGYTLLRNIRYNQPLWEEHETTEFS